MLARFIKGGQAEVWFVAEPTATGWRLFVVPQPDHLYPGGTARRFDGALREISRKLSSPAS
jgi:hypothetical protein